MTKQHLSLEAVLSTAFEKNPALQEVLEEHRSVHDRMLEKMQLATKGRSMQGPRDLTTSKTSGNPGKERRFSSLPLSNCDDSVYITNIEIGGQSLPVKIDTGSSDLWVESSLCDETCTSSSTSRYGASQSSTFRPVESSRSDYHIEDGMDEAIIGGTLGYETLTLGDIEIPNQIFLQASSTINNTNFCNEVGLLGLGFSDISGQDSHSLLSNLKEQQITMFSLYLTDHNNHHQRFMKKTTHIDFSIRGRPSAESELTFGGVNPKRYKNCLAWHEVGQNQDKDEAFEGYWDFALEGVSVGSSILASSCVAMVDSGTTLSIGPKAMVRSLVYELDLECFIYTDSVEGFEEIDCDDPFGYDVAAAYCSESESMPSLIFSAGGKAYPLTASELFRKIDIEGHPRPVCFLNFLEGVPGYPGWLLGTNFLRKYYTVFDFGQKRLGIAEASTQESYTVCQADSGYFVREILAKPVTSVTATTTSSTHSQTSQYSPTPDYSSSSSNDASGMLSGFLFFAGVFFAGAMFFAWVMIGFRLSRAPAKGYSPVAADPEEDTTHEVELPTVT